MKNEKDFDNHGSSGNRYCFCCSRIFRSSNVVIGNVNRYLNRNIDDSRAHEVSLAIEQALQLLRSSNTGARLHARLSVQPESLFYVYF